VRKPIQLVKKNNLFSLKDFKAGLNKGDDDIKLQREKYIKNMSKHNQFLSQKYIDGIKAEFENKIAQKQLKKNIKYGRPPHGRKYPQSSSKNLNSSAEKSKGKIKFFDFLTECTLLLHQFNKLTSYSM
jgi:hypothetical protein